VAKKLYYQYMSEDIRTTIIVFFVIVIFLFLYFRVFTDGSLSFYNLIIVFFVVSFIIVVSVVASVIKKSNENNVSSVFPSIKNPCPDYWVLDETGNCVQPTTGINIGITSNVIIPNFVGNVDLNSNIPFANVVYSNITITPAPTTFSIFSSYNSIVPNIKMGDSEMNVRCQLKKWASQRNIEWDGITNYNQC